ncbi:MAG: hypothetical protein COU07_00270 [Candidatus Harrisonbacteria bacterium CG10_big_fil_rev_8_21_14_0_10_40_38]|uniref:FtsK gamma domain-containing protein n=1 Tax=Candidatus Harrisonbacteria bacterium CG10_big_fil_rev_8_21_14_0_10_40_38 TaxID=1974583 RepID=A0A2H0USF9_9BACT|nr:MAG: hypothetical protein COU07_00270 [Candidatus Harrisonbacteria bacterium CG10_big_fil_rev_8_21_14_0_10_40_38]
MTETIFIISLVIISALAVATFVITLRTRKETEKIKFHNSETNDALAKLSHQHKQLYTEILTEVKKYKEDNNDIWDREIDDRYEEAKKLIYEANRVSASFLQRKLKIGYAHAAKLLDKLEEDNLIGPGDGAKPREVFISEDDLEEKPPKESPYAEDDDLYLQVRKFAIETGKISAPKLQRQFKIGYARAACLLDLLEERGIIESTNKKGMKKVLVTEDGIRETEE